MPELAYKPFKGRTIRLTDLGDCCTPPAAGTECAVAVFDSFTTVSIEANVEEGEQAFERKANGDVCINERDPNLLQDLTTSLTLCQVKPEIVSMLTGWPVTRDASGAAVGFDIMSGTSDAQVGVEIWSGVAGIDCGQGARYGYNVLPCTSGWQIDGSVEWAGIDTIFAITLTSTASDNHGWGSGPYAVQNGAGGTAGPLLDPMQTGSLARIMTVEVPPPAVTDGCVVSSIENGYVYPPVPVPAPELASISPTSGSEAGGETVTLTGTGFTAPAMVDFGGVSATDVLVSSLTEITVTAPAGTGSVDVELVTDGGADTLVAAYSYTP